jgi:hypothetical protein
MDACVPLYHVSLDIEHVFQLFSDKNSEYLLMWILVSKVVGPVEKEAKSETWVCAPTERNYTNHFESKSE